MCLLLLGPELEVSHLFFLINDIDFLKSTSQLFCRISYILDLSGFFFLMVSFVSFLYTLYLL